MSTEIEKSTKRTRRGGGPKTKGGKAKSSMNALKHGVQSTTILPEEERAFTAHQKAVMDSLEPDGYLQERLAERVALTLWRLRRLEIYEAAMLRTNLRLARERSLYQSGMTDLLSILPGTPSPAGKPVGTLSQNEVLQELKRLVGIDPHTALLDWSTHTQEAEKRIGIGTSLMSWLDPETSQEESLGFTSEDLLGLPDRAVRALGISIKETLDEHGVEPAVAVAAIHGSEASPELVEAWADDWWLWELKELPPAWALVERTVEDSQEVAAVAYRAGVILKREGERVLELGTRAFELATESQMSALMLSDKDLEKVRRYEAHLDRVLSRTLQAFHDQRKQTPASCEE